MKKPNMFIVGEGRSGTTALIKLLSQHPQIFMTSNNEPDYFCDDLHKESDKFHKKRKYFGFRKLNKYLGLFKNVKNEKIIGERSINYSLSKVAARNIYKFNPNSKIIFVFREPLQYICSVHSYMLYREQEDVKDIKKALDLEVARRSGMEIPKKAPCPTFTFYSERTNYLEHYKRFLEYFPRNQIKIIISEDLKNEPISTYKGILEFLGVDLSFKPVIGKPLNVNKTLRRKWFKHTIEGIRLTELLKKITSKNMYSKLKKIFYNITTIEEPRRELDEKIRFEFMEKHKGMVEKLSKITNINLIKKWGYDKI